MQCSRSTLFKSTRAVSIDRLTFLCPAAGHQDQREEEQRQPAERGPSRGSNGPKPPLTLHPPRNNHTPEHSRTQAEPSRSVLSITGYDVSSARSRPFARASFEPKNRLKKKKKRIRLMDDEEVTLEGNFSKMDASQVGIRSKKQHKWVKVRRLHSSSLLFSSLSSLHLYPIPDTLFSSSGGQRGAAASEAGIGALRGGLGSGEGSVKLEVLEIPKTNSHARG